MNAAPSRLPIAEERMAEWLCELGERIREAIVRRREAAGGRRAARDFSRVADLDGEGDTIYAVDRIAETAMIEFLEERAAECPLLVIAEGLAGRNGQGRIFGDPARIGRGEGVALIIDPVDGTRGFMTDKRSAWALAGAAPLRPGGPPLTLADLVVAAQTEIPTGKQWRADQFWAIRGRGARGAWTDMRDPARRGGPLEPSPSAETDLGHGFVSFARFFPGAPDEIAEIETEVLGRLLGPPSAGRAIVFEDQYISTGGQLHELMRGADRLVADLRPLMEPSLARRGLPPLLACHPYDLASALVAEEAGVIVTDATGAPPRYPLDTTTPCAWAGYANRALRERVEPVLLATLRARGLI